MESKPDFENWGSRDFDVRERQAFWDAMRPWIASKGYELYNYVPTSSLDVPPCLETPSTLYTGSQELPYAYLGSDGFEDFEMLQFNSVLSPLAAECRHRFQHAQDSQGRHVVIKAVKGNTDEIEILKRLRQNIPPPSEKSDFTGVIPVLDILPYEENFFVVMPRWGTIDSGMLWFRHNYEILDHIHSTLKGLTVLHDNRIFHRDLKSSNMLVNYARNSQSSYASHLYEQLREQQRLVYAINDFDVSIVLPLDISLTESRLYAYTASTGVWEKPYGVLSGELDYNPFAYDVGCLGIYLCENYQHLTGNLPFLAPLFDRMVTANISKRLTARQALAFFEEERADLNHDQLCMAPARPPSSINRISWGDYDRWEPLSLDMKRRWSDYRMERPSWWARQLQYLRSTGPRGVYLVHYIRVYGRAFGKYLPKLLLGLLISAIIGSYVLHAL